MDILEITDSSLMRDKQRIHHCTWADCHKSFTRKSDLKRHYRIHTKEKPFACSYPGCGKSFVQKSALTVHLRTHSGEKPHCCKEPNCGKRFSDSSSLARHRHTHSGKRTYQCSFGGCHKQFYSKGAYTNHHRGHMDSIKQSQSPPYIPPISPRSEGSPTSTCPPTPSLAMSYASKMFEARPILDLCVAENPSARPHHVQDIRSPDEYFQQQQQQQQQQPLGGVGPMPIPVFRETLRYPKSACRLGRSDTMSSFDSMDSGNNSPSTPPLTRMSSGSHSPSPTPGLLPPLHEHLGILSRAASTQAPIPTTTFSATPNVQQAAGPLPSHFNVNMLPSAPLAQQQHQQQHYYRRHPGHVHSSGARFAPY